jgi:hypothetical protein
VDHQSRFGVQRLALVALADVAGARALDALSAVAGRRRVHRSQSLDIDRAGSELALRKFEWHVVAQETVAERLRHPTKQSTGGPHLAFGELAEPLFDELVEQPESRDSSFDGRFDLIFAGGFLEKGE